jgi:hypothetical protein
MISGEGSEQQKPGEELPVPHTCTNVLRNAQEGL